MRQLLAESDFPAISKDALDALKQMPDGAASIQRLANIVLRDYALTLKVLRTANSAYYKRAGQHIQSATHAMLLLGARTVRNLAASLLVFDHYRKHSPGLKELMLLSMLTANHARELAMRRKLPDPEEAHLAGMFRNLGEVLCAGYFAKEYARVLLLMEDQNKSAGIAAFEVFGFTFEDLGESLAKHWGMPDVVARSLRGDSAPSGVDIVSITAFSHELTQAIYRRGSEQTGPGVTHVLSRYEKRLSLTQDDVTEIMKAALRETKEIFSSAKVTLDDLRLKRQYDAAVQQLGNWKGASHTPPNGTAATVSQDAQFDSLRSELIAEMGRADPTRDHTHIFLSLVETAFRGGPFDRVVYCALTPDGQKLVARFGLGNGVEQLLSRFSIEVTPREGPLAVAMLRRQSVYVPVERDFSAQDLRFAQALGAGSFGVFPVFSQGSPLGAIYCDRPWNAKLPDAATVAFVRDACAAASQALEVAPGAVSAVVRKTPPRTTPQYAAAVKGEAVLRVIRGEAMESVAGELGVTAEQLRKWQAEFLEGAMKGLKHP